MKKITIFFIFLITLFSSTKMSAVSYRGFVEGGTGVYFLNVDEVRWGIMTKHTHTYLNIPLHTTHGVQIIKNLFVGLGLGVDINPWYEDKYYYENEGTVSFGQIYGDIRWDGFGVFGAAKRVSPFADLKIGYQHNLIELSKNWNGLFISPTLGVRIGCSSKVGINLGLYFTIINFVKCEDVWGNPGFEYTAKHYPIGLTVGVDF